MRFLLFEFFLEYAETRMQDRPEGSVHLTIVVNIPWNIEVPLRRTCNKITLLTLHS
jgi:hypothetical protein